jgi:tight adherence protein B
MAGVVAILFFGFVLVATLIALSVLSAGVEEYERKYSVSHTRELGEMFLFVSPRHILYVNIVVVAVFVAVGLLVFGNVVATVLLAAAGLIAPTYAIRYMRARRIRMFEAQLVDSLDQMASALRAGLSLQQAMDNVAKEASVPLGQEFGLMLKELRLGVPMDEALTNMADRVGSDDLRLVTTASNICRQLGGNMAEVFETIAATVRDRFRLEGRIRALTAQGKLQGWVVASMPLILGLVLNWMRPDLMGPMLNSWFGYGLIAAIVVMEAMGILLIRRIVAIDI